VTAIAGVWYFDGRPFAPSSIERMQSSQRLYGPDHEAAWSEHDVALSRSLLRTVPEDIFDQQPLIGGGGRFVLVADIRLDNRDDLVSALAISDAAAKSDAALLLLAFERWHENCVDRIVGDYAFAVWDRSTKRLLLVRDPMGSRPLHYFQNTRCFAFASMPKGLHALAEVPYEIDDDFFARGLLYYMGDGTKTCFKHVRKLLAGQALTVEQGRSSARQYWEPAREVRSLRRPEDYHEALREQLDRAVASRLRGAQDVATQLSGGLDSSAVTATTARLLNRSRRRIFAFTAVPRADFVRTDESDRFVDEGAHAAATAALYSNVEHVLIPTPRISPLVNLDRAFHFNDHPIPNLCNAVWIDAINEAAKARRLNVMLVGSLGNLTASYGGDDALGELTRTGRFGALMGTAATCHRMGSMSWRGIAFRIIGPWLPGWLWRRVATRLNPAAAAILHESPLRQARRTEVQERLPESQSIINWMRPSSDSVALRWRAIRWNEVANFNKGVLARWRLDYRDPFADRRLVEFCFSVPAEQFLAGGRLRGLSREAFSDRLPEIVVNETRRGLQAPDWYMGLVENPEGIRAELDQIAASPIANSLIDTEKLHSLIDNWPTGGWQTADVVARYRTGLLRGISVGNFVRQASRSNAPSGQNLTP
jgi:asparagine synthase (glutamine-hydrolysing)